MEELFGGDEPAPLVTSSLVVPDFSEESNQEDDDMAIALGAVSANVAMEDLTTKRSRTGTERALAGLQALPKVKLEENAPSTISYLDGVQLIEYPVLEGIPLPPVDGIDISRDDRLRLAAIYVDQALLGQRYTFDFVSNDGKSVNGSAMTAYLVSHNLRWLIYAFLAIFLIVGFFERPPWCWSSPTCTCNFIVDSFGFQCIPVPRSALPFLPNAAALALELFACIGLLALDSGLKLYFLNSRKWLFSWESVKSVLLVIAIVDDLVSFGVDRQWRIAPWTRPFVLALLNFNTRRAVFSSLRIFYLVVDVMVLIFALLMIFSWMALIIWQGTAGSGIYFTDYLIAMRELHVALTTANFPDVMVPSYSVSSFAIVFFVAFYALGLFFLFPYALASIYNGYKDQLAEEAQNFRNNRRNMLKAAFYTLDESKG